MFKILINILKTKKHKNRLHKQFQDIQKWQSEMYNLKSREELELH